MKPSQFTTIVIFWFLSIHVLLANPAETGINFNQLTWQQAKQKAQVENKLIFVDFYATWCGPCKRLAQDVFTNAAVGEYFNANFINLHIDAEKEELALVESINLKAYPTLVVFDKQGNQMLSQVGYVEPKGLIGFGKKAANYQTVFEAYKKSPNDYIKLGNYLSYIAESQPEKANELALNYLEKLDKELLLTEEAWHIFNYVNDYNSGIVTYVYNNLQDAPSFLNAELDSITFVLINKALKEAIEQQDLAILSFCKSIEIKYRQANGTMDEPEAFYELETDLLYYKHTSNLTKYAELLDKQSHTYYWDKPRELEDNAIILVETFYEEETALDIKARALSWVNRSKELEPKAWQPYYTEAIVYYYYDEYQKAGIANGTALELIGDDDLDYHTMLLDFNDELVGLMEK